MHLSRPIASFTDVLTLSPNNLKTNSEIPQPVRRPVPGSNRTDYQTLTSLQPHLPHGWHTFCIECKGMLSIFGIITVAREPSWCKLNSDYPGPGEPVNTVARTGNIHGPIVDGT